MKNIKTLSWMAVVVAVAVLTSSCGAKKGKSVGAGTLDDAEYTTYGDGSSTDGGIGLGTLKRVHFDFDSSNISEESKSRLSSNAKTIKGSSKMKVLVEGHCDERGSNEYNIALGERRARAVMDYLVNMGVQRSRMELKSWGEERPLDTRTSDSAYRMNRRAEFVILSK